MVEEGEETQYIFFPPVPLFVYGLYISPRSLIEVRRYSRNGKVIFQKEYVCALLQVLGFCTVHLTILLRPQTTILCDTNNFVRILRRRYPGPSPLLPSKLRQTRQFFHPCPPLLQDPPCLGRCPPPFREHQTHRKDDAQGRSRHESPDCRHALGAAAHRKS